MDQNGKSEIEAALRDADLLDADVTNDPGRENVSPVHIYANDIDPAQVIQALSRSNLGERSNKLTGPRLQYVNHSLAVTADGPHYSILFTDLNV